MATILQKQMIATMGRRVFNQDEDAYRNFLESRYGVRSCTQMSKAECSDCIDMLKHIESGRPVPARNRDGLWASDAQRAKMRALFKLMGWVQEHQVLGFIERQTRRKKSFEMLTKGDASKVIVGLQRIIADGDSTMYKFLNSADAAEIKAKFEQSQR